MRWRWQNWILVAGCAQVILFFGFPALLSHLDDSPGVPMHKAKQDLELFAGLIKNFHTKKGRYPRDDEGLSAVLDFGVGLDPATERRVLDPWGRSYIYRVRADGSPQLYSSGPNRIDEYGKGDDVSVSVK